MKDSLGEKIMELEKIAPLFLGWEETLIWSCLQGCMGYAISDNEEQPSAAQIVVGDFCFFAGKPNIELVKKASAPIIIPQNTEWEKLMESVWGNRVKKEYRYSIKKETNIFNIEKLRNFTKLLDKEFVLNLFDQEIYNQAKCENWSKDFCSQFVDYADYQNRGLGVAIMYKDKLVAGASSYTVYNGGIEIEIDTKKEFRQKGLATACGAKLILECLEKNLYPSWDAHDLRSVALAEKLGYHKDKAYPVYIML